MRIGTIGCGIVGSAVAQSFRNKPGLSVSTHDKKFEGSKIESIENTDVCFICVPAPTQDDGKLDLSIIYGVLTSLDKMQYKGDVVIKSTVVPGSCEQMQRAFFKLNIIHNPEFLREATAEKDFENQSTVLLSGKNLRRVMDAYSLCLPGILFETSDNYSDTELAKYIHNCFLAMKVIFMSELFAYQNKHPAFKAGQDLHRARKMAASQGGIGFTHLDTPASDGRLGFGGMCFPKDLRAFLQHQGDSCKAVSSLLHITQMINQQARPELYEKKRPIHLQKK